MNWIRVLLCTAAITHALPACSQSTLPHVTNSLDMRMVLLPAGRFEMGKISEAGFTRDHAEFNVQDDRQHPVVLTRPFYLSSTEVTRAQFKAFLKDTRHKTSAETNGGIVGWDPTPTESEPNHKQSFRQSANYTWSQPGFEQEDDHPVVGISFRDATVFCEWLSKKENKSYRLPTEAEWEYAARAGTQTHFSFGDVYRGVIHEHANIGNIELEHVAPDRVLRQWIVTEDDQSDGHVFTAPVASYTPNPFGLHDMHGNVWEWCQDKYLDTFYDQFKSDQHQGVRLRAVDPMNDEAWNDDGDWRVIRGGCWYTSPIQARSGCRGYFEADDSAAYVGFRVAMDGPPDAVTEARERYRRSESAREKLKGLTRELRERRKGVLTVVVENRHLTDEFFRAIRDLDEPVDLEVNASGKLTGDHVRQLVKVKDLRGLKLSGTGNAITDDDIEPIATKPELELLQITGTVGLSDAMMPYLSQLKHLRELSLHGDGITDAGLAKLPELSHIVDLHIPGTQGTGSVLQKVTSSNFRDFQCRNFGDDDFKRLLPFSDSLRTLHLSGDLTDSGLKSIEKLRNLSLLSLSDCPNLTDEGMQVLGNLAHLRTLRLKGTAAGDLTIQAIVESNHLREIQIGSQQLTNRGVILLSEMVGLRELGLHGHESPVTDEAFVHFWRMRNLRELLLVAPKITGAAIAPMVECGKLERLTLSGQSVNDTGIQSLAQLQHLRNLTIGGWNENPMPHITDKGLQKLSGLPKGVHVRINLQQVNQNHKFIESLQETASHLRISGF